MSLEKTRQLAGAYCNTLTSQRVVLNKDNTQFSPASSDGAVDGGRIAMTVMFDKSSCAQGTSEANQKTDFASMSYEKCFNYMFRTLHNYCDLGAGSGDAMPGYTFLGGVYGDVCALWSITSI
jgi:hypothetical protein